MTRSDPRNFSFDPKKKIKNPRPDPSKIKKPETRPKEKKTDPTHPYQIHNLEKLALIQDLLSMLVKKIAQNEPEMVRASIRIGEKVEMTMDKK